MMWFWTKLWNLQHFLVNYGFLGFELFVVLGLGFLAKPAYSAEWGSKQGESLWLWLLVLLTADIWYVTYDSWFFFNIFWFQCFNPRMSGCSGSPECRYLKTFFHNWDNYVKISDYNGVRCTIEGVDYLFVCICEQLKSCISFVSTV